MPMRLFDTPSLQNFLGLVASASVTAGSVLTAKLHPAFAVLPVWGSMLVEWATILGIPGGLLGVAFYARVMYYEGQSKKLDVLRKEREEREAHRHELREMTAAGEALKQKQIKEAHDAICSERRVLGSCPLSNLKKEIVTGIKDEILEEVKSHTQKINQ
jgi:hypothetical protein